MPIGQQFATDMFFMILKLSVSVVVVASASGGPSCHNHHNRSIFDQDTKEHDSMKYENDEKCEHR